MLKWFAALALIAAFIPAARPAQAQPESGGEAERTVFVIAMENKNWSDIEGSRSAPYINELLSWGAHAKAYYSPVDVLLSLPNYLWLEAGTDFGVTDDEDPDVNRQATTEHLTSLLEAAGISWRSYQEGISGDDCPLSNRGDYAVRHNPMVYFDDVTDGNDWESAYCIEHVRPFDELADDLADGTTARYNFISPDVCHDMHDEEGCESSDAVRNGDRWLADTVPLILNSDAYQNGGVIFIVWDEPEEMGEPMGLIALSEGVKPGFSNTIPYTHSSLLRTVQEIFGVEPLLRDAANAVTLSDLFQEDP